MDVGEIDEVHADVRAEIGGIWLIGAVDVGTEAQGEQVMKILGTGRPKKARNFKRKRQAQRKQFLPNAPDENRKEVEVNAIGAEKLTRSAAWHLMWLECTNLLHQLFECARRAIALSWTQGMTKLNREHQYRREDENAHGRAGDLCI